MLSPAKHESTYVINMLEEKPSAIRRLSQVSRQIATGQGAVSAAPGREGATGKGGCLGAAGAGGCHGYRAVFAGSEQTRAGG